MEAAACLAVVHKVNQKQTPPIFRPFLSFHPLPTVHINPESLRKVVGDDTKTLLAVLADIIAPPKEQVPTIDGVVAEILRKAAKSGTA